MTSRTSPAPAPAKAAKAASWLQMRARGDSDGGTWQHFESPSAALTAGERARDPARRCAEMHWVPRQGS